MPKHDPLRFVAPVPVEEPLGEWPLSFMYDDAGERFYALLDDEDLEEVFSTFRVPVQRGA
ncbi:MAG TPA: hypothetical protein VMH26_03945 [Burkholderiales bacterium]|nr:hypothetical protein [Burkholderiales bacterium]